MHFVLCGERTMNLTQEHYKLIYFTVKKLQESNGTDSYTQKNCDQILQELFPYVYTQPQEQVR